LSGAELKVLLYVCRRTFGFKRDYDAISLVQISGGIKTRDGRVLDMGTGLSKRHVQRAIKRLEELHAVRVIRKLDDDGVNEVNIYTLNFLDEGVGTKSPYGRDMDVTRVGTPVSPTIYSKQHTDTNVNVDKEGKGRGGTDEPKTDLHKLPNLGEPPEKTDSIASDILAALGDTSSRAFYRLVAAKIPESFIRQKLSELKQGSARSPAKVFASIMRNYAAERVAEEKLRNISLVKQGLFQIRSP
jgi:DNA-binding transcriptional ArsR family regulator